MPYINKGLDMKDLARYLAAKGRRGDTELLHVTKSELAALRGLGSLTGARLTTNPDTGLPEAFNFKQLIPAIVGIGATVASGGTLSPLTAGLISGATTTAVTGDINQGLVSGLTGGALAGLGNGVAEVAGSGAAAAGTGEAINSAATFSDAGFAANQAAQAGTQATHFSDAAFDAGMSSAYNGGAATTPYMGNMSYAAAPEAAGAAAATQPSTMDNLANGDRWADAFGGKNMQTRTMPALMAMGSMGQQLATPEMGGGSEWAPDEFAQKEKKSEREYIAPTDPYYAMKGGEHRFFTPTRYNFASGGPVDPEVIRRQQEEEQKQWFQNFSQPQQQQSFQPPTPSPLGMPRFAEGGGVMSLPGGQQADNGQMKVIRSIRSRYRSKAAAIEDMKVPNSFMQRLGIMNPDDPILNYAFGYTKQQGNKKKAQSGNLMMPMMAAGGAIDGPGDGMSDNVPATIEGRQPARLAKDEFVVPADVVSHLGNGSSKAGHGQLYDMVARVRAARTGNTQQAPAINPRKVMPS